MNNLMNMVRKAMAIVAFLTLSVAADAAEVVYRIVEYNKQTAEFEIAACGMVPHNSRVYFENEFGATTTTRYRATVRRCSISKVGRAARCAASRSRCAQTTRADRWAYRSTTAAQRFTSLRR